MVVSDNGNKKRKQSSKDVQSQISKNVHQNKTAQYSQKFLNYFWDLASIEGKVRLNAASNLTKYLTEKQNASENSSWKDGSFFIVIVI